MKALIKSPRRYCPVCPKKEGYLGDQEEGMEVSLHCNDCHAWYTWFPGVSKPLARLDRDIPHPCNCPGCQARRS